MPADHAWEGHQGPVLASKEAFTIIACRTCGFTHATPVPTPAELEQVYRHEYYSTEKPLYLERYRQDLAWWRLVYGERLDALAGQLGAGGRRVVDVGSGPGFLLQLARQRGWDTLGIEPSRQAAEHTRSLGCNVVEEFLDDALATRLGVFDALHCSEVLEHLPYPGDLLRTMRGMLRPDGVACFCVPNDFSPFQIALRDARGFEPWWVAPPHHINYFDHSTLAVLLERCGFTVERVSSTFPIDLFLLMGDNYIGNDQLGRACHGRRMAFDHALEDAGMAALRGRLYDAFAAQGIGREVVIYARRSA